MLRSSVSVTLPRRAQSLISLTPSSSRSRVLTPPCPACRRAFASPSPRIQGAAAALEANPEPEHSYYNNPTYPYNDHRLSSNVNNFQTSSSPLSSFSSPSSSFRVPSPLPTDIVPPARSLHAELYKTTGVIDRISMISICLRRPESVPRGYQIFKSMLEESNSVDAAIPEAEVWANVVRSLASLARENSETLENSYQGSQAHIWRKRACGLVEQWEEANGFEARSQPAIQHNGLKIYQGLFAGLVSSQSPLDWFVPYLRDGMISPNDLLNGVRPSERPVAFDALSLLAAQNGLPELKQQVDELQGLDKQRREEISKIAVDEVKPVMEVSSSKIPKGRKLSSADAPEAAPAPRFAITNLREALSPISSSHVPYNRQRELETASYTAARRELEHSAKLLGQIGDGSVADAQVLQRRQLQAWMHEWLGALTIKLRTDIAEMRDRQKNTPVGLLDNSAPKWSASSAMKESQLELYLSLLPADKLALITILEIMRMVGSGGIVDGMKTLRGLNAVGRAVEQEYRAETIRNIAGPDSSEWLQTIDPQSQKPTRPLINSVWSRIGQQLQEPQDNMSVNQKMNEDLRAVWTPPWTQMVAISVGSYLVSALIATAKVTRHGTRSDGERISEQQPAFNHIYEYFRGQKQGVIKLNPSVAARLAHDSVGPLIPPKHLPMLVQPLQWTGHDRGAYLTQNVSIMRYKQSQEQKVWMKKACEEPNRLEAVFHGLDTLSSTPWKINKGVFDVVLKAWNAGDAIADIPAADDKANVEYPVKPDPTDVDPRKRAIYVEQLKAATAQTRKNHSERCKFNYNIEIARSYLNDTFYIPHNMDFRGRAYPIPPHLSPVGDDLCRGLLTFGIKKELGPVGLKWLQIHLANVYGFDKASFEERRRFAVDHEADIFDSADRPLDGNRWWLKAEDPWQCLAACIDLAAALRSPDPEKYESSLPVHQDGTCNGMQHYAALGGDVRGAKAVNLENSDRPADIYSGVADIVNKAIEADKANNYPYALLIDGPLGRKVVKQTVMTTVYGVTFVGARDQIAKQLVARGGIAPEHIFQVSSYIARKVLNCIGDLFSGARAIQTWLTVSARLIARSIPPERVEAATRTMVTNSKGRKSASSKSRLGKELMTSVIWTTPLRLPVVQPYRKMVKKQVMTALQTVYIHDPNTNAEVSPQKQATAFPPNFVHSLDATHMLLTAVSCGNRGITFASVHDSYWTHAATVEPMSEVIRDRFINLHSQDIIGQLREDFLERYGEHRIPVDKAKRAIDRAKDLAVDPEMADTANSFGESVDGEVAFEAEDDDNTIGLSPSELKNAPVEKINGQKFVKFKDVLPPPPPRGVFDVERIRDSAYFFS